MFYRLVQLNLICFESHVWIRVAAWQQAGELRRSDADRDLERTSTVIFETSGLSFEDSNMCLVGSVGALVK